ncbi:hypothetical protein [Pragia fontium]|uniref:hypothetical protein n=1 Tax=Pragia fontium TaxID=82985 RepID=UPI00064AE102|nr:hypothetical protein [Pragia fontium]AKJ42707.1 hypothetical protein QQ39_11950 [Pragia fontium]
MEKGYWVGICILLLTACVAPNEEAMIPTISEADSAVKNAFLHDAKQHDNSMAMDMVKNDIGSLQIMAVDNCEIQEPDAMVCDVYSDFKPAGSHEVRSNRDKVGFVKTDGEWVAKLHKPQLRGFDE